MRSVPGFLESRPRLGCHGRALSRPTPRCQRRRCCPSSRFMGSVPGFLESRPGLGRHSRALTRPSASRQCRRCRPSSRCMGRCLVFLESPSRVSGTVRGRRSTPSDAAPAAGPLRGGNLAVRRSPTGGWATGGRSGSPPLRLSQPRPAPPASSPPCRSPAGSTPGTSAHRVNPRVKRPTGSDPRVKRPGTVAGSSGARPTGGRLWCRRFRVGSLPRTLR